MKRFVGLKLPRWLVKRIHHGNENDDLGSILVNIVVFYFLSVVAFFVYIHFGREYLPVEIICVIGIFLLLIMFGYWLTVQVVLLETLRKEALVFYENSKTDGEFKEEACSRLKYLYVPIPISKV